MSVNPFATVIRILEEGYYSDEELAFWLCAPQLLFEGKTPIDLLREGRKFDLLQSIQAMDESVYT